jgi:hypothetical protein
MAKSLTKTAYNRTRIMMPADFAKELAEQWPDI